MLVRIVADANGMVADLAVRPLAWPAAAAVDVLGQAHLSGDDLAELQRGAARRVFLIAGGTKGGRSRF